MDLARFSLLMNRVMPFRALLERVFNQGIKSSPISYFRCRLQNRRAPKMELSFLSEGPSWSEFQRTLNIRR